MYYHDICDHHITLHVAVSDTKIFLAAKSLWMKPLPLRLAMPAAISRQNFNRIIGSFGWISLLQHTLHYDLLVIQVLCAYKF